MPCLQPSLHELATTSRKPQQQLARQFCELMRLRQVVHGPVLRKQLRAVIVHCIHLMREQRDRRLF